MTVEQNTIQFILDGKIQNIDFKKENLSPTITVLNYLRSLPNHKGVKEGCAEGDCGACTVVIAELDLIQGIRYKAINSCLVFLPMLHGKQLITVENLAVQNGHEIKLHPVQQALAENNGSQCGYCTPGFVMSMFALYKNNPNPTKPEVEDALVGNLCRCTGYQPMFNAFESKAIRNRKDQFEVNKKRTTSLLEKINKTTSLIKIQNCEQLFFRPNSLQDALELRLDHPDAIIVNGSTDIALKQSKKFETIPKVLDLSGVKEFSIFEPNDANFIIGAGLPLQEIKDQLSDQLSAFNELLNVFASKQIRNLATLGGNIGTASPIGDTLPLLFAYKAQLKLISLEKDRIVKIEDFITAYRQTVLQKDELIHSVIIPNPDKETRIKFFKVSKRKDLDISTVSAGFSIAIQNQKVKNIILAYGGMAEVPKRAKKTEEFLLGKDWNRTNIEAAMAILQGEFYPISDARSGKEFRNLAATNLLMKFYAETSQ